MENSTQTFTDDHPQRRSTDTRHPRPDDDDHSLWEWLLLPADASTQRHKRPQGRRADVGTFFDRLPDEDLRVRAQNDLA